MCSIERYDLGELWNEYTVEPRKLEMLDTKYVLIDLSWPCLSERSSTVISLLCWELMRMKQRSLYFTPYSRTRLIVIAGTTRKAPIARSAFRFSTTDPGAWASMARPMHVKVWGVVETNHYLCVKLALKVTTQIFLNDRSMMKHSAMMYPICVPKVPC